MDSDLVKAVMCFAFAVVCWYAAPEWVEVGTSVSAPAELRRDKEVPCSDTCEQPEDGLCSGATLDCPSHWEVWNTLPPTCN